MRTVANSAIGGNDVDTKLYHSARSARGDDDTNNLRQGSRSPKNGKTLNQMESQFRSVKKSCTGCSHRPCFVTAKIGLVTIRLGNAKIYGLADLVHGSGRLKSILVMDSIVANDIDPLNPRIAAPRRTHRDFETDRPAA